MKFFSGTFFSLLALVCVTGSSAFADYAMADQGVECRSRCNDYVCGCNPLYCGALDFQVHGGVLPISWHDRGNFSVIQCAGVPAANPVVPLFSIPKFSKLFKLPWTVGFQFGYALSDNVRVYYEFDYAQAKGKSAASFLTFGINPNTFIFSTGKYKLYEMYVGGRYYFDRWCEKLSFFLGVKAGFVHHNSVNFNLTSTPPTPAVTFVAGQNLFRSHTVPSGGFDFGLDYCYCGNWSFVLTGAVIASCGPKSTSNIPLDVGVTFNNNLLISGIGAELRFPVTLGVRYSF